MEQKLSDILDERGNRYGDFAVQAEVAQKLKLQTVPRCFLGGGDTEHVVLEALEMICTKLSRIVCGDPTYADNWVDIAGYATRVAEYLEREKDKRKEDEDGEG